MASFKLSALITDIKGKMQGNYFKKTNNDVSLSIRPTIIKNKSLFKPNQQHVKTSFSLVVRSWANLPETTKKQWNTYASNLTWYTKLGTAYTPNGFNGYVQANLKSVINASETLELPPQASHSLNSFNAYAEWTAHFNLNVAFEAPIYSNRIVKIYASDRNVTSHTTPSYGYVFLSTFILDANFQSTQYFNAIAWWQLNFGTIPTSGKIFFKLVLIDALNGTILKTKFINTISL